MDVKHYMKEAARNQETKEGAFLDGFLLAVGYFCPDLASISKHDMETYLQAGNLALKHVKPPKEAD